MIRALIVGGIGSLALVLVLVRTTGSFFLVPRSGFGLTSEPAGRRTLQIAHMAHGLGVQQVVQFPASASVPQFTPTSESGFERPAPATVVFLSSLCLAMLAIGQRAPASPVPAKPPRVRDVRMGLFDSLKNAFANEEFKEDDQRVRASHILRKGDDDVERIAIVMAELRERVQKQPDQLAQIFAELARRESECSSASMGGDLGMFGPGKMVKEFDDVLFPADTATAPLPGAILGPVVTDFGCHVILVTKREQNRDQIEEKLARND